MNSIQYSVFSIQSRSVPILTALRGVPFSALTSRFTLLTLHVLTLLTLATSPAVSQLTNSTYPIDLPSALQLAGAQKRFCDGGQQF